MDVAAVGLGAVDAPLTYPTPDATAFAAEVASLMPSASPLHRHPSRGLDHGAWVPLRIMYPLADLPVLQLSLPDHFLPLFVTLGAASDPGKPVQTVIDGYWMGLAKRSFQVA